MPQRYEVRITATAQKDLREVIPFIAQNNPDNAAGFMEFLGAQTSTLESMPTRCPLVPENKILGSQYRHLICGDYRIIFKIEVSRVFVMRIVHGSRLMEGL